MSCGQGLLPAGLPVPGQELVQTSLRQVGDPVDDAGELPEFPSPVRPAQRLGHRTAPMVTRYTRGAAQERLARTAIVKLEFANKSVKNCAPELSRKRQVR